MISRIEFLYKHYNINKRIKEKMKLNNKKIKYIINQKNKINLIYEKNIFNYNA